MSWFYAIEDRRYGPVDVEELKRLARLGRLSPSDRVWHPDMGESWAPASTVPGLFDAPEAPTPSSLESSVTPSPSAQDARRYRGPASVSDLMALGRGSLSGYWGEAVAVTVVFFFIQFALEETHTWLVWILSGPLMVGLHLFFLDLIRGREPGIGRMFHGFRVF